MHPQPERVDVVISGAGPAGLLMGAWMSKLGIKTRFVDKRSDRVFRGQADGLNSRSMEIFHSIGVGHLIQHEAHPMIGAASYAPGAKGIERQTAYKLLGATTVKSNQMPAMLSQGNVEAILNKNMDLDGGLVVERSVLPSALEIDRNDEYPVKIELRHIGDGGADPSMANAFTTKNGHTVNDTMYRSNLVADDTPTLLRQAEAARTEYVHAKYLVGCDGAHSWVRKNMGITMEGAQSDYLWGVMDIVPVTDFPDIRKICTVQSLNGSMLIIPRERGLTRLYVQMDQLIEASHLDAAAARAAINPDKIFAKAKRILEPFTIDYHVLDWWTAYQVGHRISTKSADDERDPRVFLAGDAVHTHSPKMGQGLNTSLQDTWNLGWKIAGVIKGWYKPEILTTYSHERRRVAELLLRLDTITSYAFSGKAGVHKLNEIYNKNGVFMNGTGITYEPNLTVSKPANNYEGEDNAGTLAPVTDDQPHIQFSRPAAAKGLLVGMRLPPVNLNYQAADQAVDIHSLLKADGRWRLFVMAGDVSIPAQKTTVEALGERLLAPSHAFGRSFKTHTEFFAAAKGKVSSGLVEAIVIHRGPKPVPYSDFSSPFFTFSHKYGWTYESVYTDSLLHESGDGTAYEELGVDKDHGAMILVRPDQHVAWVGELEDSDGLDAFLSPILNV